MGSATEKLSKDEFWNDERIGILKSLWETDHTASFIGEKLGVTRNAVIGKVHRLGISKKSLRGANTTDIPPEKPKSATRANPPSPPQAISPPTPVVEIASVSEPEPAPPLETEAIVSEAQVETPVDIPASGRVTIFDLKTSSCRWPLGDPQSEQFSFCGKKAITGCPYCPEHSRIAYQPALTRKSKAAQS